MVHKKAPNTILAFVNAVASGMDQYKAYLQFIAKKKGIKLDSARSRASRLLKKSHVAELYRQAVEARKAATTEIIQSDARVIAKEFSTTILTVNELDAFHSAIIQGFVEMVENITVYTWHETYDKDGNLTGRERRAGIMKATRPPNIRERQISIDALYRRGRAYPAVTPFGGGGSPEDDGEEQAVDYIIYGDGSKHLLFPPKQIKG